MPFSPSHGDATQRQTDINSSALLEPKAANAIRNYCNKEASYYLDKADELDLTAPEMTVLLDDMRAMNTNTDSRQYGVLAEKSDSLTNNFFANLLDMSTQRQKTKTEDIHKDIVRKSSQVKYTATPVALIFGSNSELRAAVEVYAFR